jgi:hypothetical protein
MRRGKAEEAERVEERGGPCDPQRVLNKSSLSPWDRVQLRAWNLDNRIPQT